MTDTPPTETAHRKRAPNGARHDAALIMKRREYVASLTLRGQTVRKIAESLKALGIVGEDGEAFNHTTIVRDLKAIKAEWRAAMLRDFDEHVSETVAEINEAARMAIAAGDVQAWLKAIALRVKVQGLEAPTKERQVTWEDELIALLVAGTITPDEVIAELGEEQGRPLVARARLGGMA